MKRFIGYFDYLEFKEVLLNNSEDYMRRRAEHLLRDIETSLSQNETMEQRPGVAVADLNVTTINCLNISDTVIFWTPDDSADSCLELLNICHMFNWKQILFNFPVRGAIIYDDFHIITGQQHNPNGAVYSPNLMYGKGLYHAHEKTEMLNWAGTVIDNSLHEKMSSDQTYIEFLEKKAIKYRIPYKGFYRKEYAMRLADSELNDLAFANTARNIYGVFEGDNKSVIPSVEEKIKNTLAFIEMFREKKSE